MKLAEWARSQNISYKTAWRWFHDGMLPVPAVQLPTGTILVNVEESAETRLQRQVDELREENAKLKAEKGG